MKAKHLLILGFLVSFFWSQKTSAQIESVNFWMKYDSATCRYDCYVIMNAGQTTTDDHRIAFNSQFSVVLNAGDSIIIDQNYEPKQTIARTTPAAWGINSKIKAPAAQPGNDFWSITPTLSPTAYYPPGTQAGDTIKLFSIKKIGPTINCGEDIRIFINGVDPNSSAAGMLGSDFSNGFTMGSPSPQLYNANSVQARAPIPTILGITTQCSGGIEIDLTATTSSCQGPLTYQWSGPLAYAGTSQDVSINPATTGNNGTYKVVITDAIGCTDSTDIVASAKPYAGVDRVVCTGTTNSITGSPLTIAGPPVVNGVWTAMASNPTGATLTVISTGVSSVAFNNTTTSPKIYNFIYTLGGCSDTMQFTVNPRPTVTMTDNNACIGDSPFLNLTPTTLGTWTSSNPLIATVTNGGITAPVSSGAVIFTYTRTSTGCTNTVGPYTVNPKPTLSFPGASDVCIGGTTQVNPSSGGTWSSSNPLVATITNAGIITGVAAGTVTLTFTETLTGCFNTISTTVKPKPTVSIVGTDKICIGTTTTLSPASGGSWISTSPLIASVSNVGVVTGILPGTSTFIFTDASTGCSSNATLPVTVNANPTVTSSFVAQCIGATLNLSPNTGGTWVSNNTAVATVIPATGVVTTVGAGIVNFTFTNSTTLCSATTPNLVVNPKPTVTSSKDSICVGSTANIFPSLSAGASWANFTPTIVSLGGTPPARVITGLSGGFAKLVFTEAGGCKSDTLVVKVLPRPIVDITGDFEICVGQTTTVSPTTGGTWISTSPLVADVSNVGLVTGLSPGTSTFRFTLLSNGCISDPTAAVTVKPTPIVAVTGPSGICIGGTSQLSTSSASGTWVSTAPAVASVTSSGLVTGLTAGVAKFVFTDDVTGCVSQQTTPITVYVKPVVSFAGPNTICVGQNTFVLPSSGGTWVSSNPAVATINAAGVITALATGSANFTFTATSSFCPSDPLALTVSLKPTVDITGDDEICIGETTQLSPTSGGSWVSSNPGMATVNNAGEVTGISQGVVFFTFTNDGGCASDPTAGVTINGPTAVSLPDNNICIGDSILLNPSSGGSWVSTNTAVAIINGFYAKSVAAGTAQFIFTNSVTGCTSPATPVLTVDPKPITVLNDNSTCVGVNVTITPNTGGSWSSSNPAIATISPTGTITPLSPGRVAFTFTKSSNGCDSNPSDSLTVEAGPIITLTGDSELCIGETTQFTPNTGGTWVSSAIAVATINNSGLVTAVSQGQATFQFTFTATGCKSQPSAPIIVHPIPVVSTAATNICIGFTTQLSPSTGGTWVSTNDAIATVTNTGLVTGVATGGVQFIFTNSTTNCVSNPTDSVFVGVAPIVSITGDDVICVGGTTTLSPTSGGTWTSNSPGVAIVNNEGIVTAVAPGKVTFTFTSADGCSSASSTDTVTVGNCTNPDFNATFVNIPVNGDVSTNDPGGATSSYGLPTLTSKPIGSNYTITMNPDGTYVFTADMIGVYYFLVPVCGGAQVPGCPSSELTITVTDHVNPAKQPIANVDIGTTFINTAISLNTLANDRCMVVAGCTLDPASVSIIVNPNNGGVTVNLTTGFTTYTPNLGFTGQDTLTYRVCVFGEPANCATAKQIISVYATTAINTTVAADDFNVTQEEKPVSGNVKDNDNDPEGDTQTVTAQTTTVPAGTLVLASTGAYTFTPTKDFLGPVDFIYETCDDGSPVACVNATLHILVIPDLTVKVRVYLEGALMDNQNAQAPDGRPLMRDNLRLSNFTSTRNIPNKDPYKYNPADYDRGGLEIDQAVDFPVLNTYRVSLVYPNGSIGQAQYAKYDSVYTPSTVFAVTGQNAIVDWVVVELRSQSDNTLKLATRSGLLQRDGDVVDLDGYSGLKFPLMVMDTYYVVVRHRSHLGAMSKFAQTPVQLTTLVNFTKTSELPVFDYGTSLYPTYDYTGLAQNDQVKFGYNALWAGTFDINRKIKADNPNDDLNILFFDIFGYPTNTSFNANFDFAYGYMPGDFNMDGKSKYDNPNDDKNMLYAQLLFYPLNTDFLSNFDFFIEQVP